MSFLKQYGWVIPTTALAVGALALIPSALATATATDLPAVETAAVSSNQLAGEAVAVDGQDWAVMKHYGSRRKPKASPFRTPSGNLIIPGTGVVEGTNPAGNP